MHTEILRELGLSDKEISIYLALLRFGTVTATKIAQETSIDRTTSYRFLSSLINKGLVSYVIKNNVKYFTAANPAKFVQDLKNKLEQVNDILPDLDALANLPKEDTKVELYKGKEGLKTVMKDILRERKPYTFIGEVEKFFTELPIYTQQWLKQVERLNIKGKLICNNMAKFQVAKTESYRLISNNYISRISTWTYANKSALFIWSIPFFAVVIENKDVTQSNVNFFNFLWNLAASPSVVHMKSTKLRINS
jgi:sugar-specific transcriptional regulator TrmB